MLSNIKQMQDIIDQRWIPAMVPTCYEDGEYGPDSFYGEIITVKTGDHVCWLNLADGAEAFAEMICTAHDLYLQMRGLDNSDDYIVPGVEADAFLKRFETFVMKNAGG